MNKIKIWPHGALIVAAFAILTAIGAALWVKYERTAEAKDVPNAARLDRVHGQVGINHSTDNSASNDWIAATQNTPVSVGDRVYTRDNSGAEIAFTGRNFATLGANTSLDVLDLSNQRTQVALREGSALLDLGSLGSGQLFEVATPCGAMDLQEAGLYRVAIDDSGNATLTALSGRAQLVGQNGSGVVEKGETMTVPCQGGTGVLSRVDAGQAGELVDTYYRARYPRNYDGRYRNYYTYLDDPYYYDPYQNFPSYNYVSEYIPGIDDLDSYGDWRYVNDYGYAWCPRVDSGWAPYQSGSWEMDYPYGLTWVSNEPWGYAPYHYGRWTSFGNQWYWVPDSARSYPTYSPALVAFLPYDQSNIAWVPLGPGDPYSSWYYDQSWQPVYYSQPAVIEQRIVNVSVPGAVTVVPVQDFTRVIDPGVVTRVDPQRFGRVRPVLDPLTIDPLRQAAFQTRSARQRVDVPRAVAQRITNTPVITSTAPSAPRFKRDLARTLRVESVSDRVKNQKIQFRDERQATARQSESVPGQPNLATEQARERQMVDLARQASRGDRNARQQMQELRRQQVEQQRAQRVSAQQPQAERIRQQMQPQQQSLRDTVRQQQQAQRAAAREQMISNQQQRRAAAQQQIQIQRQQRAQPPAIRHSQQQQQIRSQAPVQMRREQPKYRPQAQPRVMSPPAQRAQPQIQRAQPQIQRAQPQIQRAQPQIQRAQPQVQRAQPQVQRAQPQVQRAQPQVQRAQPQVQRAQPQPQRAQPQVQKAQPQPQRVQQPQAQPQATRPEKQQQSPQGGGKGKKP